MWGQQLCQESVWDRKDNAMIKMGKGTRIFFIGSVIFWLIFALLSVKDLIQLDELDDGKNLMTISGTIEACEQYESDDYIYFSLPGYEEVQFRITTIKYICIDDIAKLKESGKPVTLQVKKKEMEDLGEGEISIVSLKSEGGELLDLKEYIMEERWDCILGIGIGAFLSIGALWAYLYLLRSYERMNKYSKIQWLK